MQQAYRDRGVQALIIDVMETPAVAAGWAKGQTRPVDGDASPGETVLDGRLLYQACNQLVCLRPSSAAVQVRVSLRPGRAAR